MPTPNPEAISFLRNACQTHSASVVYDAIVSANTSVVFAKHLYKASLLIVSDVFFSSSISCLTNVCSIESMSRRKNACTLIYLTECNFHIKVSFRHKSYTECVHRCSRGGRGQKFQPYLKCSDFFPQSFSCH